VCSDCGGALKPETISFGQRLDPKILDESTAASEETDLMIVVGTSLVVGPANLIPMTAKRSGATVVIINMTKTYFDGEAALCISHAKCGEVLQKVMDILEMGEEEEGEQGRVAKDAESTTTEKSN